MTINGFSKRTKDAVRRVAPRARHAARDRRLRRHLGASARHASLAATRVARRRRSASLLDSLTDRRALAHAQASVRELRKGGSRLRRPPRKHRLRNAVLVVGPTLVAASFLRRRGGAGDAETPSSAGLGRQGPLQGDVATGGDPHAGLPGGHAAQELAGRDEPGLAGM